MEGNTGGGSGMTPPVNPPTTMIRICPKCDLPFDDKYRRMFPCPQHPELKIATLQPMKLEDVAVHAISDWIPKPGWLMLTPVILPDKTEAGLILPESATVKSTSGIVVKLGGYDISEEDVDKLFGKEVFFAQHDAYKINDTDTGAMLYILHHSKVIMWRTPKEKPKFFPISKEKDGVSFPPSLAHSLGGEPS